jgi:hypothetical protein
MAFYVTSEAERLQWLEGIERALASPTLSVKYADKTIVYRSFEAMEQARQYLLRSLGKTESQMNGRPNQVRVVTDDGWCP